MRYFAYDPDEGLKTFETAFEARRTAERWLKKYRDDAVDGTWQMDAAEVCWGEIRQFSKRIDYSTMTDYGMVDADRSWLSWLKGVLG